MRRAPFIILIATATLLMVALAAPLLRAAGASALADAAYGWLGHICHQAPERSLHLLGHGLGVCGRCVGVYAGATAVLAALLFRIDRRRGTGVLVVTLAAAPLLLVADVGLASLGVHESTLATRTVSGLAFGGGLAALLVYARGARLPAAASLQVVSLLLLAVPSLACKKPVNKDESPPAQVAPKPAEPPTLPPQAVGCVRDTDCKGNRVCANGECIDREVPIIVEVPTGCARDTDCKGNRVCIDGDCRESQGATVVETKPSTGCDDCPGKCLDAKQKCNEGSVRDCFLAGACMCECKLAAGGCGSTPEELRSCISTNRGKAKQ